MAKVQVLRKLSASAKDSTLAFYDENATLYARQTAAADMSELYGQFLPLLPAGGRILDVGCGGGRDLLQFKIRGFTAIGIDPVPRLAQIARRYSGCDVIVGTGEGLKFVNDFDGVWACASLLHSDRSNFQAAIERIANALRVNGVLFLSMQEGKVDSVSADGRFYAHYTSAELNTIVSSGGLTVSKEWTTQDTLPGRASLAWLNLLATKL